MAAKLKKRKEGKDDELDSDEDAEDSDDEEEMDNDEEADEADDEDNNELDEDEVWKVYLFLKIPNEKGYLTFPLRFRL